MANSESTLNPTARQLAFRTLRQIDRRQTYTDVAVNQALSQNLLSSPERGLFTELVYGVSRQQRRLDYLLTQLGDRPSDKQPPNLRRIVHLGLYQLSFCDQIPAAAAVNTSVELAKQQGLKGLSKVVNGMLRRYQRALAAGETLLPSPDCPEHRGIIYSLPDWIVSLCEQQLPGSEAPALYDYFNQSPHTDIRVNALRTTRNQVQEALSASGITTKPVPGLPQGLRLLGKTGSIPQLPGFQQGWWTVQDASAQWVTQILAPQSGETIFDVCAAPGGKTTHMAEHMGDQGQVWAGDRTQWRLQKLATTQQRLRLTSIQTWCGDLTQEDPPPCSEVDRALLDVPCSGLGTLHHNPDLRWHQSPEQIQTLVTLQAQLLAATAPLVKPGGILVYSTCTLNPEENQAQIQRFLQANPTWLTVPFEWVTPQGTAEYCSDGELTLWPHRHDLDGFFIAKLQKAN